MISVKQLTFTYPGNSTPTVKGIDFVVSQGEIFGFLGPSGAGKSTTQKLLIGMLRDYSGSALVGSREIRSIAPSFYHDVGVVFEFPNLYTRFTALENLHFFAALYGGAKREPIELLREVDLQDDAHTRVANFSKGMKMRLNFCRGLLNAPKLLFLDEPTSGLDPINARRIKDIVLRLRAEGTTIFLTTHNMHDAEDLCDRVAFMIDGTLPCIDSPRALKLAHGTRSVRVEYRPDGSRESRDFPLEDIGTNAEFLQLLRSQPIETIHTQEASLEQIFIDVTGRSLL
ncbi:MAG: ATP-binding cassette domain-containing protein [Chitinivibrionales bacterium]|nr:ATP-binding cassette domain-containing protein [Chitinivibrionales bacterium]